MTIGDGAMLPLSGDRQHRSIALDRPAAARCCRSSSGVTLQGGGRSSCPTACERNPGTAADVTLTNVDNTISGAGQLGGGLLTLTTKARSSPPATTRWSSTRAPTSPSTRNAGGDGLGRPDDHRCLANSGLIWANGGNVTIGGEVTGDGTPPSATCRNWSSTGLVRRRHFRSECRRHIAGWTIHSISAVRSAASPSDDKVDLETSGTATERPRPIRQTRTEAGGTLPSRTALTMPRYT